MEKTWSSHEKSESPLLYPLTSSSAKFKFLLASHRWKSILPEVAYRVLYSNFFVFCCVMQVVQEEWPILPQGWLNYLYCNKLFQNGTRYVKCRIKGCGSTARRAPVEIRPNTHDHSPDEVEIEVLQFKAELQN
ncbi:hypothetical protein J6590_084024 [Homalodisca vitripennis]|nr:hypothetical protein J6590_084024 [Homalodisca vitripennis]